MRLRRSFLYMPGTDWRKIEKAAGELDADSVCIDLEDGVALSQKAEGRETALRALQTLEFGRSERLVRINALEGDLWQADLDAVMAGRPDGIVVPKVNNSALLSMLDARISAEEQKNGITAGATNLLLVIETAAGVIRLDKICDASPRIDGLIFGAEDYSADVGAVRTEAGLEVLWARSKVIAYAHLIGADAIDIVFPDFRNDDGFRAQALEGMRLGFTGKQLIHPGQIGPVHEVYMPTEHEIAAAMRVVEAHRAFQESGTGAFSLDGKMVDMPVVRQAERVLERAGII